MAQIAREEGFVQRSWASETPNFLILTTLWLVASLDCPVASKNYTRKPPSPCRGENMQMRECCDANEM
jgi:hypothetical protein